MLQGDISYSLFMGIRGLSRHLRGGDVAGRVGDDERCQAMESGDRR